MTYEGEDGAPPGRYSVGLRWPEADAKVLSGPKADRLKEKYRDPTRTTWRVTIDASDNSSESIQIPRSDTDEGSAKQSGIGRSKTTKSHDGPRLHAEPKPTGP
jgi:hypothetical protein